MPQQRFGSVARVIRRYSYECQSVFDSQDREAPQGGDQFDSDRK